MERAPRPAPPARGSAHLGLRLRKVLLNPDEGFEAMFAATERRARTGQSRVPEGVAPYLLSAVGGAAAMLLWLKIGGLLGARRVAPESFGWATFTTALVVGATVVVLAQLLWASVGSRFIGADEAVAGRDLRLVWGVAAFPQVLSLVLLLPLDLSIGGRASYATTRLGDSLALTWAAVSIALGVALAAWSLFLFVCGLRVALRSDERSTLAAITFGAIVCAGAVVAALSAALVVLAGAIE
jgi:hypothetical protein